MVALARQKPGARHVPFLVGDMTALPLADSSVDVITTGYGLRNVPGLERAIAECARVLRPGGTLVSLDFNHPRQPLLRSAYLLYLTLVGSAVGFVLHGDPDTVPLHSGVDQTLSRRRRPRLDLRRAGFADARWHRVLGGLMAIHVARR